MIIKDYLGREQDVASLRPNMNGMLVAREVLAHGTRGPMKEHLPAQIVPVKIVQPVDWPREGRFPSYDYERAFIAACYGVTL